MTAGSGGRWFAFAALSCAVALPSAASADDAKASCARAAEAAQAARLDARLLEARRRAAECARDACPSVIERDCVAWASEIDAAIPSFVVQPRDDAGQSMNDVRVIVDGAVATRLDGQPMPVDPGSHHLVFEATGYGTVTQDLHLDAGDQKHVVDVVFVRSVPLSAPIPSMTQASSRPSTPGVSASVRWTLVGVGAAGLAAFGTLGVPAHFAAQNDRDTCAPTCSSAEVSSLRTRLILGDVGLGVGVLGLGAAAWFTFVAPHTPAAAAFAVPVRGGAAGGWQGAF